MQENLVGVAVKMLARKQKWVNFSLPLAIEAASLFLIFLFSLIPPLSFFLSLSFPLSYSLSFSHFFSHSLSHSQAEGLHSSIPNYFYSVEYNVCVVLQLRSAGMCMV